MTNKKAKKGHKMGFERGETVLRSGLSDPEGKDNRKWPECADSKFHKHVDTVVTVKEAKTGETVTELDHVKGYVMVLLRGKKGDQLNSLMVGLTGCQSAEIINGLFEAQQHIAKTVYGDDAEEMMQKAYRLAAGIEDHWADEKSTLGEA